MAWYDVDIGGIAPLWVSVPVEIDREAHTIKLRCAAIQEFLDADPKTEIEALNALASLGKITNEALLNLGSKLFSSNYIEVTINNEVFEKCALHPIVTVLDEYYAGPELGSVIEYEINLEYEVDGRGGSVVFTPFYNKEEYTELEYHFFYDPDSGLTWDTTAGFTPQTKFTEGGIWIFTLEENIKRVEVRGNGDNPNNYTLVPGFGNRSYIEVNKSDRVYWNEIESDDGITVPATEQWGWDLDTKLIVSANALTGATSIIPSVPVRGGILDNTVLTKVSGVGPDTITVNGNHVHNATSLTVDALTADVETGVVYGIDRRVVVLSTGPKVPSDSGHANANSNYGCYLEWIRLVYE